MAQAARRPEPDRTEEELARAALRQAIARRDARAADVAETERAASAARTKASEIENKIEAIARERRRPATERTDAAALVAALIEDRPLAVMEPVENEEKLKAEAVALRQAHERLTKEILPAKRDSVGLADMRVREAARAVVGSAAIERLMDGLAEMQAEVLRRRVALNCIISSNTRGAAAAAAQSLIYDKLDVGSLDFSQHPERGRWEAALAALAKDADAKLPVDQEEVARERGGARRDPRIGPKDIRDE